MGAIGGEELTKWEKMQGPMSGSEEKILVLVRLRPLSEKENTRSEVSDWECINETTILFRNSLQERSMFPTAYSFDGVFGGDCSTRQVYDEGVKEIALSVVRGVNSSIFAYGQTSSGKTYTMVGVTEFAVADIYDYIQKHEERAFVLKFSAMEIYNEAIRDLLCTDITPLRVLDDPEKGTIVEKLTEVTLRDWSHLKELLAVCEAQRKIGETSLNETSSRSHQILRLTIESSAREFIGKDNSTTLSASVNFIDLAGSERASQALSVGTRLKEGCHINRSLLTLGTVIRKLSKGRNGHVNYRDSKLTRILQPSLGGNARTAIICTLSPARSHVEQSRNTLLFATCAKEVTTNAKVNVVMSDKALVKHLQKELARLESELRTPAPSSACNSAALLRKKDLQIEKLEKEVRELSEKCNHAESRVEDLLHMVENDQDSNQQRGSNHRRKWHEGNKWDEECSVSESSEVCDTFGVGNGKRLDSGQSETLSGGDSCKEVRCVEMNESIEDEISDSGAVSMPPREVSFRRIYLTYGPLEQRIQKNTIDSLVTPYGDNDTSPRTNHRDMSSSRNDLTRSPSSKGSLMDGSPSRCSVDAEEVQSTPPGGFDKMFPGRPEGFQKIVSQSSIGSFYAEELNAKKSFDSADERIPTVDSFVAEMKEMAKLEYEKYQEPNALSSSEPVTSNDSEADSLCIKCNRGGNLLVCSEVMCPLPCHMECLGCPPHFDSVGRFLCPYCAYKLVMLEVRKAEKEVVLARKALSVFLDKQVVDDDAGGPVRDETDMVQGTDQNLTLKEVVHKFSDKVQFDVAEVRSDHECGTSGAPCDAATSSALSEPNGMLGNVRGNSDKGRDSHGEEETADRVEIEPRENAQQTKVGVESGKPVEGIGDDSEVEEEYITTVDDLQNQRVVGHRKETDVTVKRRKLSIETEKSIEEETLPDAEIEQEITEAVDDIQSKRMAQCDQEPATVRRNLSIETEKSLEEEILTDAEIEQDNPEALDDLQSMRMESRQSMYGRKRRPWTAEEEEMLKVGVARFAQPNKNISWKKILDFGRQVFHETRGTEHLKGKWKRMK